MDCNKDVAVRARALAERKFLDKDFVGAKELIMKAQELSKEVGDIHMQQMLTVCDVHCAAGAEEDGQIDWYGILQVPETADDAQIKKQYRKLSLLLHPDKNKFGGAEAAFKLVGEANETLTDRSKRSLYDMKRVVRATQTSFWTMCPYCGTRYEYPISVLEKVVRCWNKKCFEQFIARERVVVDSSVSETSSDNEEEISETSTSNEEERVMGESSESSISETSSDREEESSDSEEESNDSEEEIAEKEGTLEKSLELDPAMLSLDIEEDIPSISSAQVVSIMYGSAVHDMMEQALPLGANQQYVGVWKNLGTPQKSLGTAQKAWPTALGLNLNVPSHHAGENTKRETDANTTGLKRVNEKIDDDVLNDKIDDFVNSPGLKRLRKNFMFHGDHNNKETSLNKVIAIHNDLTNGVNICSTEKRKVGVHAPCGEKSFNKIQQMETETMHSGQNGDGKEKEFHDCRGKGLVLNNDDASNGYRFTFVDPEFFDFGQLRDENAFRANQIWAVRDDEGCMPRFYAQITKVKTMPYFMLHFVWLELDPTNEVEAAWSFSGLPVACGHFKYGKSDTTKETGMFSRTISFEKSKTRNCFEIYPREGEVWALFKGWDIGWSSDPNNHKCWSHQYELVQVISDLTMSTSIGVMPLVKIKGYDNLFMQPREAAPYVITQGDILRFSHCIPHHVMSAIGERVPEGSLELDPAALPVDLGEVFTSVVLECSSERSQEPHAKYPGSSGGNISHQGSMSVDEGRHTTSMNAGIAAKTPKEVDGEHSTTTASDDKFTFPDTEFVYFKQLQNEKGVPKVSVEIDPAALPLDMVDNFACEIPESSSVSQDHGAKYAGLSSGNSSCKGSMNVGEGHHTICMNAGIAAETPKEESRKHNTCPVQVAEVTDVDGGICQTVYLHAQSKFCDFSEGRLLQKFSPGQIWALYSDVNKFPNYYGFIHKVNLKNGRVQVRWLDVCPHREEEKRLLQEEQSIGCGIFRLSSVTELETLTDTDAFSHCVDARSTGRKGEYEIIPHLGEIWAVYKNWRVGWTAQDFGRCEYELVEVLGRTASSILVQLLRKVDSYSMVFMPYQEEGSVKTIRQDEYPKFSHQIPCFRLTCEDGGKLRGCLELDPLSLPEEFLNVG